MRSHSYSSVAVAFIMLWALSLGFILGNTLTGSPPPAVNNYYIQLPSEALDAVREVVEEEMEDITPQEIEDARISGLVSVVQGYALEKENLALDDTVLREYVSLVDAYASEHSVDVLWVLAMIWQESRFSPSAISKSGAVGLMQIMPKTGEWLGVKRGQLRNPEVNIEAGVRYLSDLISSFGDDLRLATIAYNQGITNVKRGKYRTWYYTDVEGHYTRMSERVNEL